MARLTRDKPRMPSRARERGAVEPGSIGYWLRQYLTWLAVNNYSPRSVEARESGVGFFVQWCKERGVARPEEVSRPILERYKKHLFYYRTPKGKPLSFPTQHMRLSPLRTFFRWLTQENVLLYNPASDLRLPKYDKRLPRQILTAAEVEAVLTVPDVKDPFGLRDRAILETLYSTGIRRGELVGLTVWDLDRERATLIIRNTKSRRDRVVPIGERALMWVTKYLDEVRPQLVVEPDQGTLFISRYGEAMHRNYLSRQVRLYVKESGVGKSGSCHMFRHSCATLMLEGGCDVRFIQQLLGHADASATAIYTHVSIRQLQRVHALTHPASSLKHEAKPVERAEDVPTAADVLARLDDEADEERDNRS